MGLSNGCSDCRRAYSDDCSYCRGAPSGSSSSGGGICGLLVLAALGAGTVEVVRHLI